MEFVGRGVLAGNRLFSALDPRDWVVLPPANKIIWLPVPPNMFMSPSHSDIAHVVHACTPPAAASSSSAAAAPAAAGSKSAGAEVAALRLWQADVQSRLDGAAAGSKSAAAEVAALRLWQAQAQARLDGNAAEAESSQRELGVATALIDGQAR